jgi:hypothetical protein
MKQLLATITHGSVDRQVALIGRTISDALATGPERHSGNYLIDPESQYFDDLVAELKANGEARHGWVTYEVLRLEIPAVTDELLAVSDGVDAISTYLSRMPTGTAPVGLMDTLRSIAAEADNTANIGIEFDHYYAVANGDSTRNGEPIDA